MTFRATVRSKPLAAAIGMVLLIACSPEHAPPRSERGDTVVVRVPLGAEYPGQDASPDFLRTPEDLGVTRIQCIAALPGDGVAVFDGATPALVLVDSLGRVTSTLGREGAAPGEYRKSGGFDCLASTSQGLIALVDGHNGRIARWTLSGAILPPIPMTAVPGGMPPRLIATDTSVYLHLAVRTPRLEYKRSFDPLSWAFVQAGPSGLLGDTILPTSLWGAAASDKLFAPQQYAMPLPEQRILRASSERPHLLISEAGKRPLVIELPWSLVTVGREEAKELEAIMTYRTPPTAPVPPFPGVAQHKPHFSGVSLSNDGMIWLRRAARAERGVARRALSWAVDPPSPMREHFEPAVFFGLSVLGEFVGQLRLPHSTQAVAFGEGTVWAVTETEDGEPLLGKYRIP